MKYYIRRWHYLLGLFAAIWLILLSISGFLLNHTAELKLKQRFITTDWVLDYYGIKVLPILSGIKLQDKLWLIHSKNALFLGDQRLENISIQQLQGAILFREQLIVMLADNTLFLLTLSGDLIEKLVYLPVDPQHIGMVDNQVALKTKGGFFVTNETFSSWKPVEKAEQVNVSKQETLPNDLKENININNKLGLLNIERILLDLHSGRLLGGWGVYVMDAMGLILLWLVGSGGWLWLKRQLPLKTK
ncbi:MAG: hypothetical protein RIT27_1985 [Pseudomonadota bacterium]|jgi:hypothetical protein